MVANILAGLGVITEPKLVETSRKDFVAEYEGQSSVKTARTIDRAVGGVLFIDEAYTLVQERDGRADPFGTEALETLLARMENDRDRLVVIIAGYSADIDRLLESNDGLRSRFSTRIEFDSYTSGGDRRHREGACRRPMIRRLERGSGQAGARGGDAAESAVRSTASRRSTSQATAGTPGSWWRPASRAATCGWRVRWTSKALASSNSVRSTATTWPPRSTAVHARLNIGE